MAEQETSKSQITKAIGSKEQVEPEESALGEEEEEEDLFGHEICTETEQALVDKNTESFACLAQLLLSRSSLLRHPLYHFPPLEDPGIDAAFYSTYHEELIDYIGVDKYRSLCKELKIMALTRVVKSLQTSSLNLKYYGLTHKQLKAISKALRNNIYVKDLNLEENYMDPETAHYIGEMLRENDTLQVLNMRECRIGPKGAQEISEGILTTQTLVELDLSCNSLGGEGLKNLRDALKDNCTIKRLNLSKNDLGDDCIPHLVVILSDNFALNDLDLSWNRINSPQAWKQLVNEGLIPNKDIHSLNLSWNAISSKLTMRNILKYTKETETLEHLDLSNNMISGELVKMMKALIMKNHTLLSLNIGFNQLTPADAQMLVELLLLPPKVRPKLEILNMDNVYVKKDFLSSMKRAENLDKKVIIGGVLGNWTIEGPNVLKLLFDRCRMLAMKPKKKKLRRDFSHFIFALPDSPMNQTDFANLVKKFKMKMVDQKLLDEMTKQFKYKKRGIDPVAMREKYLEIYPDAQPPPKKEKKKKKKGKKKKGEKETEKEKDKEKEEKEKEQLEEGGDQGEESEYEEWGEEEEEEEEMEAESDGEEEEEVEEEEEEGEEVASHRPIEVAHGESVTDIIAEIGDEDQSEYNVVNETDENAWMAQTDQPKQSEDDVENKPERQPSEGLARLEPISEVSGA